MGRKRRNRRNFRRRRHFERDARFGSPRGIIAFSSSRMSIAKSWSASRTSGVSMRERGVASSAQYISRARASRVSFSLVIGRVRVTPGVGGAGQSQPVRHKLAALSEGASPGNTPPVRIVDEDDGLRAAAFAFLTNLTSRTGGIVQREDLRQFTFKGQRISLEQNMRGIRVVAGQPAALSILTTYRDRPEDRPYDDDIGRDGYPRYKWRGTDPDFSDNVALRTAMEGGEPLAWFVGVAPGLY